MSVLLHLHPAHLALYSQYPAEGVGDDDQLGVQLEQDGFQMVQRRRRLLQALRVRDGIGKALDELVHRNPLVGSLAFSFLVS